MTAIIYIYIYLSLKLIDTSIVF